MKKLDGVEVTTFTDAAAFDSWLLKSHQRQEGVWLKLAKKSSGIPSLTTAGRMRAPGLAEVAAAKADGRWNAAYVSQRYAVILRLAKERTAAGRTARIEKIIASTGDPAAIETSSIQSQ